MTMGGFAKQFSISKDYKSDFQSSRKIFVQRGISKIRKKSVSKKAANVEKTSTPGINPTKPQDESSSSAESAASGADASTTRVSETGVQGSNTHSVNTTNYAKSYAHGSRQTASNSIERDAEIAIEQFLGKLPLTPTAAGDKDEESVNYAHDTSLSKHNMVNDPLIPQTSRPDGQPTGSDDSDSEDGDYFIPLFRNDLSGTQCYYHQYRSEPQSDEPVVSAQSLFNQDDSASNSDDLDEHSNWSDQISWASECSANDEGGSYDSLSASSSAFSDSGSDEGKQNNPGCQKAFID